MSDIGKGNFGEQLPNFFGDILRLLNTNTPVQWELAVQLAESVATDSAPGENTTEQDSIDPIDRIRLEELYQIAGLHVSDITGMDIVGSKPILLSAVSRRQWIRTNMAAWKPLMEAIAQAIISNDPDKDTEGDPAVSANQTPRHEPPAQSENREPASETTNELDLEKLGLTDLAKMSFEQSAVSPGDTRGLDEKSAADWSANSPESQLMPMLAQWKKIMGPVMLAMQFGSVLGRLAKYSLGAYEFPLPRNNYNEIPVIPQNIKQFSSDWSIPLAECEIYAAILDITSHAILRRSHVTDYLTELLTEYAECLNPDPSLMEERIKNLQGFDISDMTQLMSDPELLHALNDSSKLRQIQAKIDNFASIFIGYTDWVIDMASSRLIANNNTIREAIKRRRMERNNEERAAENFFGLHLDQDILEKGSAFIQGVLQRGGDSELAMLWTQKNLLPTQNEIEAPGLWLERIKLDQA